MKSLMGMFLPSELLQRSGHNRARSVVRTHVLSVSQPLLY
ncbi:unnamed protein product [Brassica rapa subsp. trilocularis]